MAQFVFSIVFELIDDICFVLLSRFGIGRFTTLEEIDYTADNTIRHVKRLREMR